MPQHDSKASDLAMRGGGYYSLVTKGAKDVIDSATPLVLECVHRLAGQSSSGPFTIADMGCADGGTSLSMVSEAIKALRKAQTTRPVSLYYTDQLFNDYNALFKNLHAKNGLKSQLGTLSEVSVFASATSFYEQILPRDSLDLGFSATAMHWLSSKPCDITNHVQAVGAQGQELEAFQAQGRADWQRILLHRAAELRPGGCFVMANFCRDEAGRYLGHTQGIDMFECFAALWRSFVASGVITAEEFQAMTLPQYYKDVGEFAAPLEDPENPVYQAGLRLRHIETKVTPCPYAADYRHHGDAGAFAKAYVPTLRSWTESTFAAGLATSRPAEQRARIIEDFYAAYEALVQQDPDQHAMDYVHAFKVIEKI